MLINIFFLTFDERVSDGSLWTPADGLVLREEAFGAGAAVARVLAETVDAGLVLATIIVCGKRKYDYLFSTRGNCNKSLAMLVCPKTFFNCISSINQSTKGREGGKQNDARCTNNFGGSTFNSS